MSDCSFDLSAIQRWWASPVAALPLTSSPMTPRKVCRHSCTVFSGVTTSLKYQTRMQTFMLKAHRLLAADTQLFRSVLFFSHICGPSVKQHKDHKSYGPAANRLSELIFFLVILKVATIRCFILIKCSQQEARFKTYVIMS